MTPRHLARVAAALTLALATTFAAVLPAAAHPKNHPTGTRSLASFLARDGSGFDRNWNDFDIVDNAVGAVLKANSDSPVAVLADGTVALTAFLPSDRAFRRLAHDLTGTWYKSEAEVFGALAGKLGVATIESVLLYHVVPSATITYRQARKSDGAKLTTALGSTITVDVTRNRRVRLIDADTDDANPAVLRPNLNWHNRQIAHGITRVLRPVNL